MSETRLNQLLAETQWITSDWHFGEERLDLLCRPFETTEEHDETIIDKHNSVVDHDDVVLVLGDVTNENSLKSLETVHRLNGRKILIRGNHDRKHDDVELLRYFEFVVDEGEGLVIESETIDEPCYATHYPTQGRSDMFNLVGHVHGAWRVQLNMLNVGLDAFGYAPCPMSRIQFFRDAIRKHYDLDIWAAYNDVNESHKALLDGKTKYYNP